MNVLHWLMPVCCDRVVSDSCSQGNAKDLSGENLLKLIKTGDRYVYWFFYIYILGYSISEHLCKTCHLFVI